MHYRNAWLKRCVFNLDLNRESVSEPRMLSGHLSLNDESIILTTDPQIANRTLPHDFLFFLFYFQFFNERKKDKVKRKSLFVNAISVL